MTLTQEDAVRTTPRTIPGARRQVTDGGWAAVLPRLDDAAIGPAQVQNAWFTCLTRLSARIPRGDASS